ncbi:hypothetical protein MPSEU_000164300 [Mayamaea pseudoterrestris]|nr:hypothetical protein MPSEU_000164300 [Mayamaea pseudoterrestris]
MASRKGFTRLRRGRGGAKCNKGIRPAAEAFATAFDTDTIMPHEASTMTMSLGSPHESSPCPEYHFQAALADPPATPRLSNMSSCSKDQGFDSIEREESITEDLSASSASSTVPVDEGELYGLRLANLQEEEEDELGHDETSTLDNTVDEEDAKQIQTFDVELAQANGVKGTAEAVLNAEEGSILEDEFTQVVSFDLDDFPGGGGELERSFASLPAHDKETKQAPSDTGASLDALAQDFADGMPPAADENKKPQLDNESKQHQLQMETRDSTNAQALVEKGKRTLSANIDHEVIEKELEVDSLHRSLPSLSFDSSERSVTVTPIATNRKTISATGLLAKSSGQTLLDDSLLGERGAAEYWRDLDSKCESAPPLPIRDYGSSPSRRAADRKHLFAKQTRYATVTNIPSDVVRLTHDQKEAVNAELTALKRRESSSKLVALQLDEDSSRSEAAPCLLTPQELQNNKVNGKARAMGKETRYATVSSVPSDDIVRVTRHEYSTNASVNGYMNDSSGIAGSKVSCDENIRLSGANHPASDPVQAPASSPWGFVTKALASITSSRDAPGDASNDAIPSSPNTESKRANDAATSDDSSKRSNYALYARWSRSKGMLTGTAIVAGGAICSRQPFNYK